MLRSPIAIFFAALAATMLFYFEYLPPVRQVHIPYDLSAYHFSLFDYAFQNLRHGHFPEWDPSMYSGMDFTANVQAALYYPGTWLMFLSEWGRERLSYHAVEDLALVHVPIAFALCFCWLRGKKLTDMASALGAGIYAFSGYMCLQLQHFGLIGAYAWFPLGLQAIDQAEALNSWKPLWKVAMVSALCFLAGYPPTWLVFAVCAGVYSLMGSTGKVGKWKIAAGVVVAVTFGLVLCAIQVIPAWDATHFRKPEANYGPGIKDPRFYLAYLIPNFFNFGLNVPVETNPYKEYLYLGAPGIFGVAMLFRKGRVRQLLPALAVLATSLVLVINPFDLVWQTIRHSDILADICRSAYFLAGITLAISELAARGLNRFLTEKVAASATESRFAKYGPKAAIILMGVWALAELIRWPEADFKFGRAAAFDPAIMLLVFGFALYVFRAQVGDLRFWVGLALLASVGVDYKVFGTSKRFNADTGEGYRYYSDSYAGMDSGVYKTLNSEKLFRVALDDYAPLPEQARQIGWRTPEGFDPFLSTQYRGVIDKYGVWRTDRNFNIDPDNSAALHLFGVRYVITAEAGPAYKKMTDNPNFKMLGSNGAYFKVFEYLDAQPPYHLEASSGEPGKIDIIKWQPQLRSFTVNATQPGHLRLSEQHYPGWHATVDGNTVPIDYWEGAFQSVDVPAGQHVVLFEYHSRYLLLGGLVTLLCLAGLAWWARMAKQAKRELLPQ